MDLHILGRKDIPSLRELGHMATAEGKSGQAAQKLPAGAQSGDPRALQWQGPMLPPSATPTLQCHLGAGTPSWLCDCIQLCVWLWVSWVFYPASCKFCSSASSRSKTHRQDEVQMVYIRLVIPLGGKCRTMSRLLFPVCTPLPTRPWVSVIPPPCGQVFVLSLWIVVDARQANGIRAPNLCSSEYPIKTNIKLTFKFLPT